MLMLSSYDYLGLIGDPRVDEAAIEAVRKVRYGNRGSPAADGDALICIMKWNEILRG